MERQTYGGKLLRALRNRRGWTLLDVELKKVTSRRTLGLVETGKTEIPKRETLETLLDFYEATFNEAHEIMKAFGYLPDTSFLPTEEDIAGVLEQVQPILNAAPFPAYCVDFIARLYGYNDLWLGLSGLEREEAAELEGVPIWQVLLESDVPSGEALDADLLHEIQAIRQRMAIYVGEPWFDSFIEERGSPFLTYWQAAEKAPQGQISQDEIPLFHPFHFEVPGNPHMLRFFPNEDMVEHDQRFRLIYLMPGNGKSWQWVETHRQTG